MKGKVFVALLASVMGWALDLFDLFLLLFIAPVVGALFFPASDPMLSLVGVYAGFAVSALVRPIGGMVCGSFADRRGRRVTLLATMTGVGITTALMGALPTVAAIGPLATGLFVLLRVFQGLFVGGVNAATHTIGTESVPPSWRGWAGGLIQGAGGGIGMVLASGVYKICVIAFPGDLFSTWGWRFMFFSGALSALVAFLLFSFLSESPYFAELQKSQITEKAPIKALFSAQYRGIVLLNCAVVIAGASLYYLTAGYLPVFLGVVSHLSRPEVADILMWTGVAGVLASVAAGQLGEIFGRRAVLWGCGAGGVILAGFAYQTLAITPVLALPLGLALSVVGNAPCTLIFLNERFPTAIRATGTAFCWNIGYGVGGMMPLFVTVLSPQALDIPIRLAWFLGVMGLLLLVCPFLFSETKGNF
ncbi:MAG: MFS transporter [Negativicutes bacterium]|nr:MFS transporter [Negativicutes bacterium]